MRLLKGKKLQWIDSFLFDNQCINLLFIEKKTIVICLKKCQKVLQIFCLFVFKCLKEFIFQLKLGAGIQWTVRQWFEYFYLNNQCIDLSFMEKNSNLSKKMSESITNIFLACF